MAVLPDAASLAGFLASTLFIESTVTRSRQDNDSEGKCELVGTFSLITQALLGLLCLSSLLVKRFYEYPVRRTWPVWMFDVSKQVIGAFGVHVFNVLLSIIKTSPEEWLSATGDETGDPCDWYFLSIVFDCTIGVYILYLVFRCFNWFAKTHLGFTQIESGQYGPDPHNPSKRAYIKQLGIYFGALMATKFILYGLVECFETELLWITSKILLAWLDEYPNEFEIFVVMFLVPIFMNCLQLVLIDNFIQNQVIYRTNARSHRRRSHDATHHDIEEGNGLLPKRSHPDEENQADHYGSTS
ncbi:hypothetical protein FT663_05108 [Candidozyma haemuli var. vulneris]|uniref:Vacuolar membrane protein n=1 Tax=Candidozyma haemuli TaxID=45357 RepID=A0A2V1AS27_9ASCO|nr:hypothetical protein CXQ85_002418 [[Candida] haemuloni]KAF3985408.1 hypothetical protein FT662_05171 [[Candida] haemuloni var. vulneris]KAF3985923.1 hypothetical protein FT663_05108 [[Candida] haemuloni var. vulneris]PVH20618.1 hypothetical protein CXQ85_002418 [[Candida] haemuloni]